MSIRRFCRKVNGQPGVISGTNLMSPEHQVHGIEAILVHEPVPFEQSIVSQTRKRLNMNMAILGPVAAE